MSQRVLIFAVSTKSRPYDFNEMKDLQRAGFSIYIVGATPYAENLRKQGFFVQPKIESVFEHLRNSQTQPEDVAVVCRMGQEPYPKLPKFLRYIFVRSEMTRYDSDRAVFRRLQEIREEFKFHLINSSNEPLGITPDLSKLSSFFDASMQASQAVYVSEPAYTPMLQTSYDMWSSESSLSTTATTCAAEAYLEPINSGNEMPRRKALRV